MSKPESTPVEFKFDATFYFDDLPNNQKEVQPAVETVKDVAAVDHKKEANAATAVSKPRWYRTGRAPVPFAEEVFWSVMERWILEAPSIIPPISKVEIIQDINTIAAESIPPQEQPELPETFSATQTEIEYQSKTILEGRKADRTIHRRLMPKRVAKDPIMEEMLYFCRAQGQGEEEEHVCDTAVENEQTGSGDESKDDDKDQDAIKSKNSSSQVIFAPVIKRIESGQDEEMSDIKRMEKNLPFFYPKVRGFRYGYVLDTDQDEDGDDEPNTAAASNKRVGWITLDLFLAGDEGEFTNKMQYAFKELFKKLFKWGVNTTKGFTKSRVQHDIMVPKEMYMSTYARLKEKYAQKWVESWPEKTDARKFVFEDIGIAAWLVALWKLEREHLDNADAADGDTDADANNVAVVDADKESFARVDTKDTTLELVTKITTADNSTAKAAATKASAAETTVEEATTTDTANAEIDTETKAEAETKKETGVKTTEKRKRALQSFVDLGCGNGFLTHILNEEGHPGTGIDLAARKVWDIYGENTHLKAETIIPNETVFQDVDWIIGNHADELAPWIPIIASRSKSLTRFVVIPCCFFGLSGSRYQFPKGFSEGKYKAYQEYICEIIDLCDYELQTEILRIPSTKNVALVGSGRKFKRKRGEEGKKDQSSKGTDDYEELAETQRKKKIADYIAASGEFVARISDKDKQELQKSKQAAKLSARGADVIAPGPNSITIEQAVADDLSPVEPSSSQPQ
ncbi:tRNA methyltransferase 44 [Gryganskiella cystojenkinii]|nr:tRNA methyltransferase 44 [Gryganskiella cystojenkinii]